MTAAPPQVWIFDGPASEEQLFEVLPLDHAPQIGSVFAFGIEHAPLTRLEIVSVEYEVFTRHDPETRGPLTEIVRILCSTRRLPVPDR